jgi:hypothetical protein
MVVQQIRLEDGALGWEDAPKELGPMIPSGLASGAGAIWVTDQVHGGLLRVEG